MLAQRGASVIVNDIGSLRDGSGNSSSPAELTVQEIKKNGGDAIVNFESVEFGQKIVEAAISNYGRLDIVINNAGYCQRLITIISQYLETFKTRRFQK